MVKLRRQTLLYSKRTLRSLIVSVESDNCLENSVERAQAISNKNKLKNYILPIEKAQCNQGINKLITEKIVYKLKKIINHIRKLVRKSKKPIAQILCAVSDENIFSTMMIDQIYLL